MVGISTIKALRDLGHGGTLTIMLWVTNPFLERCSTVTLAKVICDEDKATIARDRWMESNPSVQSSNHIECYWQSDRRHI